MPVGYITLAPWGVPDTSKPGTKPTWPTSGPGGYIFPAARRVANALKCGTKSELTRCWAGWLHNPCCLGSPTPQSRGQHEQWPTSGPGGYISRAAWGVPNASQRGTKLEMAHDWAGRLHNPCRLGVLQHFRAGDKINNGAGWLHNPCRLGGPQRFKARDKIRRGPQVGRVAT